MSRKPTKGHLRKRKNRWLVQIAVPVDLRGRVVGKSGAALSNVETYLGTDSERVARQLGPEKVAATLRMFDKLRKKSPVTSEEIEAEAAAERRRMYDYLERDPVNGRKGLAAYLESSLDYGRNEVLADSPLRARAIQSLKRIGATQTEDAIKAMAEALAGAALDAQAIHRVGVIPPRASGAPSRIRSTSTPFLSLAESYLLERGNTLSDMSKNQFRTTYRLFADHIGDTFPDDMTRLQVTEFLNRLAKLHRHYGRRPDANKLSLSELESKHPANEGEGLTNKTLNRHLSCLSSMFKWARERGHTESKTESPFANQIRKVVKRRWVHFEVEELNRLFAGQRFDKKPKTHSLMSDLPWTMAIALFAGMRQGEIADLDAENIKRRDGVPYFDIIESKSEAGVRLVPVHSRLIQLGFLDYVKAIDSGPLFPALPVDKRSGGRGHTIAKRFPDYRRSRGVDRDRLVFHSFRKSFVRALQLAHVDINRAALVVGHEEGFTYREYNPAGLDVKSLREVVEAVRYPGLRLPSAASSNGAQRSKPKPQAKKGRSKAK
jgi:integrase